MTWHAQYRKDATDHIERHSSPSGRLKLPVVIDNGHDVYGVGTGPLTDSVDRDQIARIRAEYLNAGWFLSLADAPERIEEWRIDYNTEPPHSALGHLTPQAFARQAETARKVS
jgi:transposase InsO family protein